jgi:arsenate reductase (glutaredoxin)
VSLEVYGIPTCSTCKKALQWLQINEVEYKFVNTKDHPPTREMIANWVETFGTKPMRNTSGQSYRALGDEKQSWTDEQWINAFSADAMLLKRPLFVKDGAAVLVGFRASEDELRQTLDLDICLDI